MRRVFQAIPMLLLMALLLSGCSASSEKNTAPAVTAAAEATAAPTAATTPEPTPAPIQALGRIYTGEETELDLTSEGPDKLEEILSLTEQLPNLKRIRTAAADGESQWQLEELSRLRGCEGHSSVILSQTDAELFKKIGVNMTFEPRYQAKKLYHK